MGNIIEEIEALYLDYGSQSYQEKCSQLQHAEQCGTLAIEQGLDNELVLAAFLHDIGHFVAQRDNIAGFTNFGHPGHDDIGAEYLAKKGFAKRIVMLVKEHVKVKRYLAASQAGYLEGLSHASTMTLMQQGGAMTPQEVERYQKIPLLKDIIILRTLDDSGKLPQMTCKPLSYWMKLIAESLR